MSVMNFSDAITLEGKVILVSGISGGIGSEIGKALEDYKAQVIGIGIRPKIVDPNVGYHVCNVADFNACEMFMKKGNRKI